MENMVRERNYRSAFPVFNITIIFLRIAINNLVYLLAMPLWRYYEG